MNIYQAEIQLEIAEEQSRLGGYKADVEKYAQEKKLNIDVVLSEIQRFSADSNYALSKYQADIQQEAQRVQLELEIAKSHLEAASVRLQETQAGLVSVNTNLTVSGSLFNQVRSDLQMYLTSRGFGGRKDDSA